MSKIHIEVKKSTNENNMTLLRRFSRKVIDAGFVRSVKEKRYNERPISKLKEKADTVKRIIKRKNNEKLRKLGKLVEKPKRSK